MSTTALAPDPIDDASPAGGTTPPRGGRPTYPLGWLRGLAALCVVTFHAYQHNRVAPTWEWPLDGPLHRLMLGSDLFVDMFFVLSGLVLWLPVAAAAERGGAQRPGRVLLYRRLARLLPLYVAVVLIVWAVTNPSLPGHWQDLALHLSFTHIYSDTYIFWTDGPAWSLAVEMHFYVAMALAVPLVGAGVRRARTRRGRLAMVWVLPVLSIVVGLSYLGWATITEQPATNWSVWFGALSRGADFGLGMGLAVLAASGVRLPHLVRSVLGLGGVVALVWLVLIRPEGVAGEWWHPAYALAITVALSSVVLHEGPWPAWMSWRPLVRVGGLGYGIYLIHEPVMRFLGHLGALPAARPGAWFLVTAVLVAVPSVALAWVSSRTIEAAGLRVLATMQKDGSPRDYYAHTRVRG